LEKKKKHLLENRGVNDVEAHGNLLSRVQAKNRVQKVYNTAYSQVVTQPGTDAAQQDLTSLMGREPVFFFLKKAARGFYS